MWSVGRCRVGRWDEMDGTEGQRLMNGCVYRQAAEAYIQVCSCDNSDWYVFLQYYFVPVGVGRS